MMLNQIASLGKELAKFLALFKGCFRSRSGFAMLSVYVQGLLSNVQRKNIEAIALELGNTPRTLQRFVESIKWEETGVWDKGRTTAFAAAIVRTYTGCGEFQTVFIATHGWSIGWLDTKNGVRK